MRKITQFPFHTLLFAIFPAISLMAHNLGQVSLAYVIRPLLVYTIFSLILLFIIHLLTRDWIKTGLIVTPMIIAWSSYGIVYDFIQNRTLFGFSLNHRLGLALAFGILMAGIAIFVVTRKGSLKLGSQFLTVVSLGAVLLPAIQLINYLFTADHAAITNVTETKSVSAAQNTTTPDIYYFILDGYSRADELEKTVNFDNSPFLNELKQMGFYIADCSKSNYENTRLSLASSLNMDYLDVVAPQATPDVQNIGILDKQILNSKVRADLEARGYEIVSFQTGYLFSEFHDADHYIQTSSISLTSPYVNPFESLLLSETGFRLLESIPAVKLWSIKSPLYEKYLIEKNKIELLNHLDLPSPKFVFIHLMPAHRPYIFNAEGGVQGDDRLFRKDGKPISPVYDVKGYFEGITYLNNSLLPIIQKLVDSKNPPIILIQGDHGNRRLLQLEILNAYYFPDKNYQSLYPSISPVNSFRIIFNKYFGSSMPLLPDRSYASQIDPDPFVLTPSIETSPACKQN